MKTTVRLVAAAAALLCASPLLAQTAYPTHPVRMIVPFAAGGPTDVIARVVAQKLSESLRQQFYVENLPGAGGTESTPVPPATFLRRPRDAQVPLYLQFICHGFTLIAIKGRPQSPRDINSRPAPRKATVAPRSQGAGHACLSNC